MTWIKDEMPEGSILELYDMLKLWCSHFLALCDVRPMKFLLLHLFSLLRTDRCLERKRSWKTSVWLYIVCWFQENFDRCDSHTSNIYRSCLVLHILTTCTSAAHVTYQSRNQFEFHTVVRVCFVFRPAVLLSAVVTDLD